MIDYAQEFSETIADSIESGKRFKETFTTLPMPANILVGKDGELIAALGVMPNRDDILKLITVATAGLMPEMFFICLDAYHTDSLTNPDTGKEWAQDEMGVYYQAHGAGVVKEALQYLYLDVSEQIQSWTLPYWFEDGTVVWGETITTSKEQELRGGGLMVDTIAALLREQAQWTKFRRATAEEGPYSTVHRELMFITSLNSALEATGTGAAAPMNPRSGLRKMAVDLLEEHIGLHNEGEADAEKGDPKDWAA